MAGRDINPNGFRRFVKYVADQLTDTVIAKLSNYFDFPPAFRHNVQGNGRFVKMLVQRSIIQDTDISALLNALNELELYGIQEDLKKKFNSCMEVAPHGFGRFKIYVADRMTNPVIAKLSYYFDFPPALHKQLQGDELAFVNTLVQWSIITEYNISVLLNALEKLKLYEIQEDLQTNYNNCMGVANQDVTKPVFISFSCKDLTKVENFVATFEEALGPKTCRMCTTGIKPGHIIDTQIVRALAEAKVVVCMISQDYIDSNECEKEALLAEQTMKKIIAVHIESVRIPYQNKHGAFSALQLEFARRSYIKLTGEYLEKEMQKLIVIIKESISQEDNQFTDEQGPSLLEPSPTPEGGDPSKTSTTDATETENLQFILFCAYCKIIFKESWQHQYHTETAKHKGNINIKKDDEKWAFAEPPLGITDGKFKLCPKQSGECSGCSHAHSQKELDEWNKRHEYRLEALYIYQQLHSEDMTDQTSKMKTLVEKYEVEKQKVGGNIKDVGNISYLKDPDQIIAKGSEGARVYVGKCNDAYLAVKRIPTDNIQDEEKLLNKMADKDPNNVVKMICIEKDEDFSYVVTPLCECDLEYFMKVGSSLTQLQQIKLCVDILSGLMSLHSMGIVHRDLKPKNVLINKKGEALLTDFGISRICTGTSTYYTAAMGTRKWIASECVTAAAEQKNIRLLKASDVQVAGYLVYYILSNGFHPFDATGCLNVLQMQQNMIAGKFQLLHLEKFPKECKSLLTDMLDKEEEKRPMIEDCLHKMKEVKSLLIQQLSEEIQPSLPGVKVLCGEWSIDITKDRKSEQTWSFRVKSGKNLQKVSFRHNDSRELFFFPSPENQPCPKELFAGDLNPDSESEGYTCFEVHFQAKEDTGLFDEQVIFEFGEKHLIDRSCQQLLVWIDPKSQ